MSLDMMLFAAAGGGHGEGFSLHHQIIVGSTVIVVGVLILLAAVARGQVGVVPKGLAACFEHVFDWIEGMSLDMIGPKARQYVPFLMSLFLFVLFSNWSGLIPLPKIELHPEKAYVSTVESSPIHHVSIPDALEVEADAHGDAHVDILHFEAPTGSYNTTFALAFISFLAFNWYGIRKHVFPSWEKQPVVLTHGEDEEHEGHDDHHHHPSPGGIAGFFVWLGHYVQPTPMLWRSLDGPTRYLLVPLLGLLFIGLNIVEELARLLSLSLRLFGNISGEHAVAQNLLMVLYQFLGQSLVALRDGILYSGVGWMMVAGLVWGASVFVTLLGTLAGFIQAMIFAVLSLVYIAHAVADDH